MPDSELSLPVSIYFPKTQSRLLNILFVLKENVCFPVFQMDFPIVVPIVVLKTFESVWNVEILISFAVVLSH